MEKIYIGFLFFFFFCLSLCPKGFLFCLKKIIQRKEKKNERRGGDDRTRTDDFMRAKHAFYQLNYTPLSFLMKICDKKWKSGTYLKKKPIRVT